MNVQARLMQFLDYKHLSKLAFSKSIGRSVSYVTNIVTSIGPSSRTVISEKYPELNMEWLLTGQGEMIVDKGKDMAKESSETIAPPIGLVPLIPISAQAGRLDYFVSHGIMESDCEKITSPILNAELAITVAGDSMAPEYTSGTKVLLKKINDKAFIDWGKTYVLDTCNGVVVKNVYPSEKEGCVKCVSINPNYPPFDVSTEDIYGWYIVLMSLSLK